MQIQMNIGFDELVMVAKRLPPKQWTMLKEAVEENLKTSTSSKELEKLLLSAPTFSKKQINEIKKTRKQIEKWRER